MTGGILEAQAEIASLSLDYSRNFFSSNSASDYTVSNFIPGKLRKEIDIKYAEGHISSSLFSTANDFVFFIIHNALVAFAEVLAFIGVFYQAWGIWKEKRSTNIQSSQDLVTDFHSQGADLAGAVYTVIENT
ncbi:hypothetical protein Clacol_000203 [Clathrus columnatus]|uniref:Uncharacterized protein n=1 Tax=Clathrus columnatus TaxID=1419009 RepID=A0AAV4ZWA9_9AGAM|nr:hypothetical protein Clacol_000203 [Clathrus columnatus]